MVSSSRLPDRGLYGGRYLSVEATAGSSCRAIHHSSVSDLEQLVPMKQQNLPFSGHLLKVEMVAECSTLIVKWQVVDCLLQLSLGKLVT